RNEIQVGAPRRGDGVDGLGDTSKVAFVPYSRGKCIGIADEHAICSPSGRIFSAPLFVSYVHELVGMPFLVGAPHLDRGVLASVLGNPRSGVVGGQLLG